MHPPHLAGSVLLLAALTAAPAHAQTSQRFYIAGGIGTFAVSADHVDGRSFATSIAGGLAIARHVDIEVDWVLPTQTLTESYIAPSVSFAPPGASPAERERLNVITRFDKSRDVTSALSAVVIFRPALGRRVTPGVIVGLSTQWIEDRTSYTPVSIPEGVDPAHPAVVAREEVLRRNIGGPTFGGQVAIALSDRLAVVPDVRYDYGSLGDEINNTLRASVRVQWRF
jgi:hypothetical protein